MKYPFLLLLLISFFSLKAQQNSFFGWAKAMGGPLSDGPNKVLVDASGNVYTIGAFRDTADFDPGPAKFNLISAGLRDVFVSKLDKFGNFLWAKSFSGTADDIGFSAALDASGNIYVLGGFQQTVDFDPGSSVYNITANGKFDMFLTELDSLGNFVWAKAFTSSSATNDRVSGSSLKIAASGNIYVTGSYKGTTDFDPGASTYNLNSVSLFKPNTFFLKLNALGNFVWAKQISDSSNNASAIAIDASENIFVTGSFQSTIQTKKSLGLVGWSKTIKQLSYI